MANVLSEEKRRQVEALGRLGWSLRRIQRETHVRRETAGAYLKAAGIAVRAPTRGAKPASVEGVISDSVRGISKPATAPEVISDFARGQSSCEPFRDLIERGLDSGRTAKSLWQELVDRHGFASRYSAVQRFVRRLTPIVRDAHVVIATRPGEEAQVDYGDGPMVRHPSTGKYRRTRLFILTLAHSRKAVRLLVWKSSTKTWAELHEQSFRRLGGVTATVVLDNLREGVISADIHDPLLNPLYRDMLAHYGVVALPCRVGDPDRKGKVESAIDHTQTMLRGLRFESLVEAQAHLDHWDERWADTRIHGTTKRQVTAMFEEERASLRPLPIEPFRYYNFGERVVHLDGFVEVAASYYAPPPGFIGRTLRVQWDDIRVRLIDPRTGLLLREHLRADRGRHRMLKEDAPSRTPPGVHSIIERAHGIGASTGVIAEAIYAEHKHEGVRRILGLVSLGKRYGTLAVERAAEVALAAGAPTYRAVKTYVSRHHDAPLALRQIDPLIRGLTEYRDVIAAIAERQGDHP